ncbi:MAG: YHS domain-containing protein [Candidatus Aminicenantales bacterium]|jgi:YHS domain-containing protein
MNKKSRLIALLAVMAVIMVAAAAAQQKSDDKAIDPVCGMTVVKASAAATYEYKGTKYYFCSTGCKEAFAKDPEKFLNKAASAAEKKDANMPMAGHMGMHGKMGGQEAGAKAMGCSMSCPLHAEGVEWVVENTPDGAVVKITSKNPETVKAIQEHLAKMKEMKKAVKK